MKISLRLYKKYKKLQTIFAEMQKVILAYSGGADSSLLLKIGTDVLGTNCIGVIGVSASLGDNEMNEALETARKIGARLEHVETHEMANQDYLQNDSRRCFYCKFDLFTELTEFAQIREINWIIDGSNTDDISDYRPGREAGKNLMIRSPFIEAGFAKTDIRELSRYLNLSTWNKPAQPCLSSRVAYGTHITPLILEKIDKAESYLHAQGFNIVRVRYLGEYVSIEVGADEVRRFQEKSLKQNVLDKFQNLGFPMVKINADGYRSGNMNKLITLVS